MLNIIMNSIQVYGIAIIISLAVAAMIKALVYVTGSISSRSEVEKTEMPAIPATQPAQPANGIPEEVVAAIAAAVTASLGQHRILHIAQGGRTWSNQGRSAQHTHQPRQ